MTEEEKQEVAVFRFNIIHEFVNEPKLAFGEQEKFLREKYERKWDVPYSDRSSIGRSTILRWISVYKKIGCKLESLYPKDRSDRGKKMKVLLVIDESSLLRLSVFTELHTLTQFENDSKPFLPLVLAGQNNLVDNLRFRDSLPLASRVVAKNHLQGVDREAMEKYL